MCVFVCVLWKGLDGICRDLTGYDERLWPCPSAGPNLFRLLPRPRFLCRFVSKFMHELPISIVPKFFHSPCSFVRPLCYLPYDPPRPPSAPFSSRSVIVAGVPARALNCFIMLDVIMPAVQFAAGRGSIPLATYLPQSLAVACPSTQFSCTLCALLWSDSASRLLHSIRLLYFLLSFSFLSARPRRFQIKMALHI